MKLVENVDTSLLTSSSNVEEELRRLTKSGILKGEILRALESAIVIVNAYQNGKEEDYV